MPRVIQQYSKEHSWCCLQNGVRSYRFNQRAPEIDQGAIKEDLSERVQEIYQRSYWKDFYIKKDRNLSREGNAQPEIVAHIKSE